jgi:hypothetical protein
MDIRKRDWTGVDMGFGSLLPSPPLHIAGCSFPADELASGCRKRDEV